MPQLKIIIKFNTSSTKIEQNNEEVSGIIKNNIDIENNTVNNKEFSSLNKLGRKKKQ